MPDFSPYFATAVSVVATGLIVATTLTVIAAGLFKTLRPWPCLQRKPFLTANEREFYHRLTRALPTHPIFVQVCFGALIAVDSRVSYHKQFSIRRRFAWKIADFVICAPYTLDPLVIIELDDSTHDASRDRKRDAMTNAAGYQTLRFQSKHKPTVAELTDLFAKLLPSLERSTSDHC